MSKEYIFTSEAVTEGHPDKICDQISDAILDAIIEKETRLAKKNYIEPNGKFFDPTQIRCACETACTTGTVFVMGEIRTQAYVDVQKIVRQVISDIGYKDQCHSFNSEFCGVMNSIHGQSSDIALGVDKSLEFKEGNTDKYEQLGAGDQGIIFGYASNETKTYMPMPIYLAQKMAFRLAQVRKSGILPYLMPDGKTQVSVRYVDNKPMDVTAVVVSSQHSSNVDIEVLRKDITKEVVEFVFKKENISFSDNCKIYINPTGRFVVGGPVGDSGLTGRKIIVDTYGGFGRHGGGAFSGKDCTKVDRCAAYASRYVVKNVVASGLAERAELQISYAIGVSEPVSVMLNCFGTEKIAVEEIEKAVLKIFDLRPSAIIDHLDLWRPIYKKTSCYGHFGRDDEDFTWESLDKVEELRDYFEL